MKILLFDDDATNIFFYERQFKGSEFTVDSYKMLGDARDALYGSATAAGKVMYDFALLDWEIDGDSDNRNSYNLLKACIEEGVPVMVRTNYPNGSWINGIISGLNHELGRVVSLRSEVEFWCPDSRDDGRVRNSKLDFALEDFREFVERNRQSPPELEA